MIFSTPHFNKHYIAYLWTLLMPFSWLVDLLTVCRPVVIISWKLPFYAYIGALFYAQSLLFLSRLTKRPRKRRSGCWTTGGGSSRASSSSRGSRPNTWRMITESPDFMCDFYSDWNARKNSYWGKFIYVCYNMHTATKKPVNLQTKLSRFYLYNQSKLLSLFTQDSILPSLCPDFVCRC